MRCWERDDMMIHRRRYVVVTSVIGPAHAQFYLEFKQAGIATSEQGLLVIRKLSSIKPLRMRNKSRRIISLQSVWYRYRL